MDIPDSFVTLTGSAAFAALTDGRSWNASADVSVSRPPWGNSSVVWLGGRNPAELTLTVYVASEAMLGSLVAMTGELGTLSWWEGTLAAVLRDVSSGEHWGDGEQKIRCQFILTD